MGKPNFNFQKRQKELAKKKKSEEKRQRKLEKKAAPSAGNAIERPDSDESAGTQHAETVTERG